MNKKESRPTVTHSLFVLEECWNDIRKIVGEDVIPEATLIILPASENKILGSFTHSSWAFNNEKRQHEVSISPRILNKPEKLLETLLHEATHALLFESKEYNDGSHIAGCSTKNPKYHTSLFREAALFLGLKTGELQKSTGYSITFLEDVPPRYSTAFHKLETLKDFVPSEIPKEVSVQEKKTLSNLIRLFCFCDNPASGGNSSEKKGIYASRKTIEHAKIICRGCGNEFKEKK